MLDEGYIKFELEWEDRANEFKTDVSKLIKWRDKMHQMEMIGHYADINVGYGNISMKTEDGKNFIISATQTGNKKNVTEQDFCTVTEYKIKENKVHCKGPKKASSESLTHAAVYEADENIKAIIHIHHHAMWLDLLNKIPTSRKNVAYGTPEMAKEIFRLFKEEDLAREKLMAMAGHEDGIIAFGKDLDEAGALVMEWMEKGIY